MLSGCSAGNTNGSLKLLSYCVIIVYVRFLGTMEREFSSRRDMGLVPPLARCKPAKITAAAFRLSVPVDSPGGPIRTVSVKAL